MFCERRPNTKRIRGCSLFEKFKNDMQTLKFQREKAVFKDDANNYILFIKYSITVITLGYNYAIQFHYDNQSLEKDNSKNSGLM